MTAQEMFNDASANKSSVLFTELRSSELGDAQENGIRTIGVWSGSILASLLAGDPMFLLFCTINHVSGLMCRRILRAVNSNSTAAQIAKFAFFDAAALAAYGAGVIYTFNYNVLHMQALALFAVVSLLLYVSVRHRIPSVIAYMNFGFVLFVWVYILSEIVTNVVGFGPAMTVAVAGSIVPMYFLSAQHMTFRIHAKLREARYQAVQALKKETAAANKRLEKLNSDLTHSARVGSLNDMAPALAHELMQPLLSIAQNVDAAKLISEQAALDGNLREILLETEAQALRAGAIIRSLRGLIKNEDAQRQLTHLSEPIEGALQLVSALARKAGVTVSIEHLSEWPINVDPVQISQVVINILRNSIEAFANTLQEEKVVNLHCSRRHDEVVVTIRDNGIGIENGIDPFNRFETTKENGVGMGMAISKDIIESHGGKIWLNHCKGGTSFSFSLPLALNEGPL